MEYSFINSKIAMVKIPPLGFTGDQIELEKYAEVIGQYGNIKDVIVNRRASCIELLYILK